MGRRGYPGPSLPQELLDKVQDGGVSKRGRYQPTRKDRRKEERQTKRGGRPGPSGPQRARGIDRAAAAYAKDEFDESDDEQPSLPPAKARQTENKPKQDPRTKPAKDAKPAKSILKKAPASDSELDDVSEEEDASDEEEQDSSASEDEVEDDEPAKPIVSRAVRSKLEEDDDEIAALEKKLGMKGSKKGKLGDDELDWLVNGSDDEAATGASGKRKRPEDDEWLKEKRRKAGLKAKPAPVPQEDDAEDEDDGMDNPFSDDEAGSEDFGGFDSGDEDDEPAPPKKERENPYVAPVVKDTAAAPTGKYIPPSLRKAAASDEEVLKQLRRQLQGLLNRLSEANMLSILQSVEEVYQKSARQHVTSTMIDLLVGLVSDPSVLNDTFLILHAGFATALFKVVGTDFGAQILEQIIAGIDKSRSEAAGEGKTTLNLIGFLSYLYAFQLTGCAIVFDYIRIFLEGLSEANTELLLRMIRTSGSQLRSDDPSALKDIVLLLQRSVAEVGEANLSVRTKFMIETINNLKNNRMKTGVSASQLSAEHTSRMKKTLGTLSARTTKATEPLRISLADIRDSDKKGKWWLVGASYHDPAKLANNPSGEKPSRSKQEDIDAGYESETPGNVSLTKLAKAQGMNTDIRRAIFISMLGASDFKDAHMRLLKLHLKNKQQLEIPRVLLHCASAEKVYNPYYTFIARKLCGDRKIRKAFQFALWDVFRRCGEKTNDADDDDMDIDAEEQMTTSKIVNLAKLYGSLIADGGLSIAVLRTINFTYMQPKTRTFAEVLLTTLILQAHKKAAKSTSSSSSLSSPSTKDATKAAFEKFVKEAFFQAGSRPEMVQSLRYFVESTISMAEIANGKKERKVLREGCEHATQALFEAAAAKKQIAALSDDEDEGGMSDY
ncbi:hypothetical protein Q7P37_006098 [Cladosporium fusiforme]